MARAESTFSNSLWLAVGKRRWLKRWLKRLPEAATVTTRDGLRIRVDLKDYRGPSFYLLFGGPDAFDHYERSERDEILRQLKDGDTFLDVGANIGLFTYGVKRALPRCTVHAFEPHPLLFRCLDQTRRLNGIEGVHCHALGIGRSPSSAELYFDESDSGGHSLRSDTLYNNRTPHRSTRVKITSLDAFTRDLERVDLIKMDIQGLEDEAIQGAVETIRRFHPRFLIECENSALARAGTYLAPLLEADAGYGWKPVGATESGGKLSSDLSALRKFAAQEKARGREQGNYLFAPGV